MKYEGKIQGAIVGTSIKKDYNVYNKIDEEKAKKLSELWLQYFS